MSLSLAAVLGTAFAGGACSTFAGADADAGDAGPDTLAVGDAPVEGSTQPDVDAPPGIKPMLGHELAAGFQDLSGVAASEDTVYFASLATGVIHSVPLETGGAAAEFAKEPETTSPLGVIVFDNAVYWIDGGKKVIAKRNVGGGVIVTQATTLTPVALAAGRSTAAGVRIVVATQGQGVEVQQYDDQLVVQSPIINQNNPVDVAVSGTMFFWTETSASAVRSASLDDTVSSALSTNENDCQSIAASANSVYWTIPAAGEIRVSSPPAVEVRKAAGNQKKPFSLAADESGVYWLTSDGYLRRSKSNETPVETLASGFASSFPNSSIQAIALTPKHVVWITSDGQVRRVNK